MHLPPTTKAPTVATEANGENRETTSEPHTVICSLKTSKRVLVNLQCMKLVQSVNHRSEKVHPTDGLHLHAAVQSPLRNIIITLGGEFGYAPCTEWDLASTNNRHITIISMNRFFKS